MGIMNLDKEILEYALIGGCILGGGGGGSIKGGREAGIKALEFGTPTLYSIDEVDEDNIILTVSGVGAPAAPLKYVDSDDYVNTVKKFIDTTGINVGGIITNENGGSATINGWVQSVKLGIPLIDAPCNGRAHPTGVMGSMGLHKNTDYETCQSVSGGNPEIGMHIDAVIKGSLDRTATLVRQCAVEAGGTVAVARNPVSAKYIKENAAIGGISHAIELGKVFYEGIDKSAKEAIDNVVDFLDGEIVVSGFVRDFKLETTGGFDVGILNVGDFELTFWNEYMTLEKDGERLSTFPDLIMTFDKSTGYPVTSAELCENQEVVVIKTNKENIKLGVTMSQMDLFEIVEKILDKEIIKYIK